MNTSAIKAVGLLSGGLDSTLAAKMRDYFAFTGGPCVRDIPLLKVGRYLRRPNGDKIIVVRNEQECKMLRNLCRENDHLFFPIDFTGPTVVLQGLSIKAAVEKMIRYTKRPAEENARLVHRYQGRDKIILLKACLKNDER